MEWLTRLDDRITVLAPAAERIVASPDGTLLALRSSDARGSLLTGEHVHVVERATGREVVAVFGREYLRAFAWASDDTLLILRAKSDSTGWLQRANVPDGGIEAERWVWSVKDWAAAIDLSVDRRRAVVRPEAGVAADVSFSASEGEVPTRTTAVVSLPSMEGIFATEPDELPGKLESTLSSLSPEGRWLFTRQARHLAVWNVDAKQEPPHVYELADGEDFAGVVWTSDRRVLVSFCKTDPTDILRIDALDVIDRKWTTLLTATRGAALPQGLRVDPDWRYAVGFASESMRRLDLVVLDVADGRVLSRRDVPGIARAVLWTADGRSLLTASDDGDAVILRRWALTGDDSEVVASIPGRGSGRDLRLSLVGTSAVLVEDPLRYRGGFGAAIVSLAP